MRQSKYCAMCHQEKNLDDFTIDVSRADGHYVYCKKCLTERSKARRKQRWDSLKSILPEKFCNLDGEIFKDIPGHEGKYQVSNFGRVRSLRRQGILLSSRTNRYGYRVIMLGQKIYKSVHALVLEAFVCVRPSGLVVNHKDGNKSNNRLSNLEWVTPGENVRHSYEVLGHPYGKPPVYYGENNSQSKLDVNQVKEIRQKYMTGEYSSRKLAKMFCVSKATILNVVHERIWKGI